MGSTLKITDERIQPFVILSGEVAAVWGWIKRTAKKVWRGVRGTGRLLGRMLPWLFNRILKLPEFIGTYLFRIRWRKYLEVSVVILNDANGKPLASVAEVEAVVTEAKRVFRRQANVRIRAPHDEDEIVTVFRSSNPKWVLNPKCNEGAFKHMFTRVGGWFEQESALEGVTIFVVSDVQGKNGCHLGPLAPWGFIDPDALHDNAGPAVGGRKLTLAHELGHSCDLRDRPDDSRTLMAASWRPARTGALTKWQRATLRTSPRVHYFK